MPVGMEKAAVGTRGCPVREYAGRLGSEGAVKGQ